MLKLATIATAALLLSCAVADASERTVFAQVSEAIARNMGSYPRPLAIPKPFEAYNPTTGKRYERPDLMPKDWGKAYVDFQSASSAVAYALEITDDERGLFDHITASNADARYCYRESDGGYNQECWEALQAIDSFFCLEEPNSAECFRWNND